MKSMLFAVFVAGAAAMATPVDGAVIIDQNFDNTAIFSPGIAGLAGSAATTDGRWGNFHATNGPFIINTQAKSGTQSLAIRRGGNQLTGRSDNFVTTDVFEISYALYRVDTTSALIVQVGNAGVGTDPQLSLGLYLTPNGNLNYYGGSWTPTGATLTVGQWTTIRQVVDASNPAAVSYDLYVTAGAGTETHVGNFAIGTIPSQIDRVFFNPQNPTVVGNQTYVDDVRLAEVPEPAALSLLALGGILMRRGRRNA